MTPTRRSLHLLLAVSLLFLSWLQLAHELNVHAHHPGQVCEVCLFTGHISSGAPATPITFEPPHLVDVYEATHYTAPTVVQLFRHAVAQRGPPLNSIA